MSDHQPNRQPHEETPRGSGGGDENGGEPGGLGRRSFGSGWMGWLVLVALLLAMLLLVNAPQQRKKIETWGEFERILKQEGVVEDSIILKNDRVVAELKPGYELEGVKERTGKPLAVYVRVDSQNRGRRIEALEEEFGISPRIATGTEIWERLLISLAPFVLILLVIWFLVARARHAAGAGPAGMLGRFGKSRHRTASKERIEVTLDDVAGVDEPKAEVEEIVRFLKDPAHFQRLGGRVPRGVLLYGPPGCGKTLLAKGIAGEADVPFYSISGSDFVEMFVGVGASRVRDLFSQAKQSAPCIIFLDEIDAIGRKRSGGFTAGGGHDEREQTLNAILSEMDGFDPQEQVIVIAATNRADVLDPALTRPGRFDRQIAVPLPDLVGRQGMLRVHAKKVKLGEDVDLDRIARGTPMFSGADLAALINEAAILATMKDQDAVHMEDLEEARDKVRFGRARQSRRLEREQREANAYHEAGHALLQARLEHADPIDKVTIIPRGQALGATFALPEKDRYGYDQRYLLATMRVLCGGRIAERWKTGDLSTGAAQDIEMATRFARNMVLEWGMSERLGFIKYDLSDGQQQLVAEKEYSEETARAIDEEIKRLIDQAYDDAERVLGECWEQVRAIAEALLKYETLNAEDIGRILRGETLEKPSIEALIQKEQRRTEGGGAGDDGAPGGQGGAGGSASGRAADASRSGWGDGPGDDGSRDS